MGHYKANNTVTQVHHVIPRHHGGTDDKANLVELLYEDHVEAHRQLYLMNPDCMRCRVTWECMRNKTVEIELNRLASVANANTRTKTGVPRPQHVRDAISRTRTAKGYKIRLGAVLSAETKQKLSIAGKARWDRWRAAQ